MDYNSFIKEKTRMVPPSGFAVDASAMCNHAFRWQKDVVRWNLQRGKSANFQDCGLGKTLEELMFAQAVIEHTNTPVLIATPLAVAEQTKREGVKFGFDVNVCRTPDDLTNGINVTNYEMLHHYDPSLFGGFVADESSILKQHTGKTRNMIIDMFRNMPYKLAGTATPAPNDFMELGNHAEFLGIMSMTEMLSTFFVHDGSDTAKWRLKGHAADRFFEWVASWACCMTSPADLGYPADDYNLPPLNIHEHVVATGECEDEDGQLLLMAPTAQTLNERRNARRGSLEERCQLAAEIAAECKEQVLVWCDLNAESEMLAKLIPGAVEVRGTDKPEHKTDAMLGFSDGNVQTLVSKPSIAGWGMNWQNCHDMIFVGLSDSFEAYYQAMRRCWRFGQKHPVNAHIITSDTEGAVRANIERKQKDAERMTAELVKHTKKILEANIRGVQPVGTVNYHPVDKMEVPAWLAS